jgi:hypothetical protein
MVWREQPSASADSRVESSLNANAVSLVSRGRAAIARETSSRKCRRTAALGETATSGKLFACRH